VNMAIRKKVASREDGALTGLGSLDKEENEQGEQTSPYQVIPGMQVTTPCVAVSARLSTYAANRGTNAQQSSTIGGGHGCG